MLRAISSVETAVSWPVQQLSGGVWFLATSPNANDVLAWGDLCSEVRLTCTASSCTNKSSNVLKLKKTRSADPLTNSPCTNKNSACLYTLGEVRVCGRGMQLQHLRELWNEKDYRLVNRGNKPFIGKSQTRCHRNLQLRKCINSETQARC